MEERAVFEKPFFVWGGIFRFRMRNYIVCYERIKVMQVLVVKHKDVIIVFPERAIAIVCFLLFRFTFLLEFDPSSG